jgi:hypothetical protein
MNSWRPKTRMPGRTWAALLLAVLSLGYGASAASAAPRAPALTGPADNATVQSVPAFAWKPVRRATAYEFQLAADRGFGSIVGGRGRGSFQTGNTYATVDISVPDGAYYWRVRSIDEKRRAGRWTTPRRLHKDWSAAPRLLGPADDAEVRWPGSPLVLRWSSVPHAFKYQVLIARDPSLAAPVVGTSARPVETSGTVFALQGTLTPGSYYWGVVPLDAQGHKGAPSAVGRFTWNWPTGTTMRLEDLNAEAAVFDPLFTWDRVAGAARYEVEVNSSQDFAGGSKVCCTETIIGTSVSPRKVLANNRYYSRVRAIDTDGNAGVWNEGPTFRKDFDAVVPTIPNLRMVRHPADTASGLASSMPIVSWDPVPGASSYQLQATEYVGVGACDWSRGDRIDVLTAATSWTPLARGPAAATPGGVSYPRAATDTFVPQDGRTYCVRVLARSDRDQKNDEVVSDWTQLGGAHQPAFTYQASVFTAFPSIPVTPADGYLEPQSGAVSPRLPLFTWRPVAGARSYWVVVAKDALFTEIVDVALSDIPAYAPRDAKTPYTYPDETTSYYWSVLPATGTRGSGTFTTPLENNPHAFDKRSRPPGLIAPGDGADVHFQPTFRWTSTEGARTYTIQVSDDVTFANPLDNIVTASTAFTSASTYPADTRLYWRVRANDERGVGLTWSQTQSFQRRLAVPALSPDNVRGGETIPLLTWSPVDGAVSYSLHVDQVDGTRRDFTLRSPAFTPVAFYGTGIWSWRVRANFPTGRVTTISGAHSPAQAYTRSIGAPSGVRTRRSGRRMVFSWDPNVGVRRYRVELSETNSFTQLAEQTTTDNTEWAPKLRNPRVGKGPVFWRVAAMDEGNNYGAFASGVLASPRDLIVSVQGTLRARRKGTLTVTVTDGRGRRVRGATVRVRGVGVRRRGRTSKKGSATLAMTPKRSGAVNVTAAKRGYRTGREVLRVG